MITEACRDLKHNLSEQDEAPINVYSPPLDYRLGRAQFDAMIKADIDRTTDLCDVMVKEAGLQWEEVAGILLVGGSCRIPFVGEALTKRFGRPLIPVADPEMAVCHGAAYYGTFCHRPVHRISCVECTNEYSARSESWFPCPTPTCGRTLRINRVGLLSWKPQSVLCPQCRARCMYDGPGAIDCASCRATLSVDSRGMVTMAGTADSQDNVTQGGTETTQPEGQPIEEVGPGSYDPAQKLW